MTISNQNTELVQFTQINNQISQTTTLSQDAIRYYDEIFTMLPKNTQRAYLSDMKLYHEFCIAESLSGASSDMRVVEDTLKAFVLDMCKTKSNEKDPEKPFPPKSFATIKRRLAAISSFLDIAKLPNPIKKSKYFKEYVRLTLPKLKIYEHQEQANPLTLELLNQVNNVFQPINLQDLRDIAIVNTAFDGLLRADEVVNLQVKDINRLNNVILIRKSKADQTGKGQFRYVSDRTLALIDAYVEAANFDKRKGFMRSKADPKGIFSGPLFRPIHSKLTTLRVPKKPNEDGLYTIPIDYKTVLRAFQRIGKESSLPVSLSAHSARVGAAVSMAENNTPSLAIQNAGGWKSRAMPARYTEQASIGKGGMAELDKLKR